MRERGLDVTTSCPPNMFRWAAITGGVTTVVAIGLLIAGLFSPHRDTFKSNHQCQPK